MRRLPVHDQFLHLGRGGGMCNDSMTVAYWTPLIVISSLSAYTFRTTCAPNAILMPQTWTSRSLAASISLSPWSRRRLPQRLRIVLANT